MFRAGRCCGSQRGAAPTPASLQQQSPFPAAVNGYLKQFVAMVPHSVDLAANRPDPKPIGLQRPEKRPRVNFL